MAETRGATSRITWRARSTAVGAAVLGLAGAGVARAGLAGGVELVDLADPTFGTRLENAIVGACYPHGSVHPGPQSLPNDGIHHLPGNDGWHPELECVGFAQLHAQGTGGTPTYGHLLLSPRVGEAIGEDAHRSFMSGLDAHLSFTALHLDRFGIDVRFTASPHVAFYEIDFPSDTEEPVLVFDAGRKLGGASLVEGRLRWTGARVEGEGIYGRNWMPDLRPLGYVLEVDPAPVAVRLYADGAFDDGAFDDGTIDEGIHASGPFGREREITHDGDATDSFDVLLRFAPGTERVVARVAVSTRDLDTARRWMSEEGGRTFAEVRDACREAWREELTRIEIDTDDPMLARMFATCAARLFIVPRNRTDDMAGIPDGVPAWDDHYTLWDTHRTYWPLLSLLRPSLLEEVLDTFVALHERDGTLGTAVVWGANVPASHQAGTEADIVIADALRRGVGVDRTCELVEVMETHAVWERPDHYLRHGYAVGGMRIRGASATLGHAFTDHEVAVVARAAGRPDLAWLAGSRAGNWREVWDPGHVHDGFTGFVRPRAPSGEYLGAALSVQGFYEETPWTYSYFVPHDTAGLLAAMGGADRVAERLAHGLERGYHDLSNQPAYVIPWVAAAAGRPDLASRAVGAFLDAFRPNRYPGQEDSGAMSSLFVWGISGLFPVPGSDLHLIHGPRADAVRFRMESGRTFEVRGLDAGGSNVYVQSATLDGVPLERPYLRYAELAAGGVLACVMGSEPSDWGRDHPLPDDREIPAEVVLPRCGPSTPPSVGVLRASPSPTRGIVRIRVHDASPAAAHVDVYDAAGRRIRTLPVVDAGADVRRALWDGRDGRGRRVSAGVYFLEAGEVRERVVVLP